MKNPKLSRRHFLKKIKSDSLTLLKAGALGSTVAAPFVVRAESKQWQWKMVTTWPKNFPGLGTGAEKLAKSIEESSGGRIKVRVYGDKELVPAMGVFDAVSRGTAEMGHGASYYWQGKHEATSFFSAVPFGLTATEMNGWLKYGGGQELWDQVYSPFGLVGFSAGNTGVQMGGWFNKEIKTPSDFKGLKMRMPGLGGKVLTQLGSAVVTLSGGEIFQALKLGTIDATEWVGPYNDLAFGLHKAAKYYYYPGWHEPGTTLECMINKKAFESLPKDLQSVVKHACNSATHDMYAEFASRNSTALANLVQVHKVQLKEFPKEVLKTLGEISRQVVGEFAKKDALSKKVYESFDKFRKDTTNWTRISEESYTQARSLTFK